MFRHLTAILLLVAFSAQTFQQGFIVLDYYANTSAFAKNCENKARPKLRCNGKCQMMKKLEEEEKKQQQVPERKAENKSEVVSSTFYYSELNSLLKQVHLFIPLLNTGKEIKMPRLLLRPPIC